MAAPREQLKEGPVLLYDGACGVCNGAVQWILAHERTDRLRFCALQSPRGQALRRAANVPNTVDSLIWLDAENAPVRALLWSRAVVQTLLYVGGPWRLLGALLWLIPRPLRDIAYRTFAAHRSRFAPTACSLPSPHARARFLDEP